MYIKLAKEVNIRYLWRIEIHRGFSEKINSYQSPYYINLNNKITRSNKAKYNDLVFKL